MTPENLKNELWAAQRIARRLELSIKSTGSLIPFSAERIQVINDDQQEKIDALLLRFVSLASMIQDRIGRSVLLLEEEDLTTASKKDMRHMLEKLGAIQKEREFGIIAELRNIIAHVYPEDLERQAAILNAVHRRGQDLLDSLKDLLDYTRRKFLGKSHHESRSIDDESCEPPAP